MFEVAAGLFGGDLDLLLAKGPDPSKKSRGRNDVFSPHGSGFKGGPSKNSRGRKDGLSPHRGGLRVGG